MTTLEAEIAEVYLQFFKDVGMVSADTPEKGANELIAYAMRDDIDEHTLKVQMHQQPIYVVYWLKMTTLFEGREVEAITSPSPFVRSLYQMWKAGLGDDV